MLIQPTFPPYKDVHDYFVSENIVDSVHAQPQILSWEKTNLIITEAEDAAWAGPWLDAAPAGAAAHAVLRACGTSVVLVQTRAGTDSADAVGRGGRCSSDEDGGARSDPAGSGRDGSISGGFGVVAAGSGEIEGRRRHGPPGGPCSARKRDRGEKRSRGRREGARRRGAAEVWGRRRGGLRGRGELGQDGAAGGGAVWFGLGFQGYFCKSETLSTKTGTAG